MKMYLVGGAVRDKLMGKQPKDFDYTIVINNGDAIEMWNMNHGPAGRKLIGPEIDAFTFMGHKLRKEGYKVFVQKPEFLTIRAHFPKGHVNSRLTADFVMARKEGEYTDGRRPDSVEPGTLEDDLRRRDFTMNAIAEDEQGNFIDPFNGRGDIEEGVIRAVGDPFDRLTEDALRALRALRFCVTTSFYIEDSLRGVLLGYMIATSLRSVSDERKMDELNKMFRHDTIRTLKILNAFPNIRDAIFAGKVNLEATMKEKGFK